MTNPRPIVTNERETPAAPLANLLHPGSHEPATELEAAVIAALRQVFDPEIPVNIYDLGLIYVLNLTAAGDVDIKMSLTAPGCPVAGEMPGMVQRAVEGVAGISSCAVELVWDPAWDKDRMSEDAKLALGFF